MLPVWAMMALGGAALGGVKGKEDERQAEAKRMMDLAQMRVSGFTHNTPQFTHMPNAMDSALTGALGGASFGLANFPGKGAAPAAAPGGQAAGPGSMSDFGQYDKSRAGGFSAGDSPEAIEAATAKWDQSHGGGAPASGGASWAPAAGASAPPAALTKTPQALMSNHDYESLKPGLYGAQPSFGSWKPMALGGY